MAQETALKAKQPDNKILSEGGQLLAEQEERDQEVTDGNSVERETQFLDKLDEGKIQVVDTTGDLPLQELTT